MGNIVILVELKASQKERQIKQGMACMTTIFISPPSHQFQLAAINSNNDSFITPWMKVILNYKYIHAVKVRSE